MSREVESRVVEMEFKYAQFKQGVVDAIKMLELLKKSLDFKDTTNSLNELVKFTKNFNTDQVTASLEQLSQAKKKINFDDLAVSATKGLTAVTEGVTGLASKGFAIAQSALEKFKSKMEFDEEIEEWNRYQTAAASVDLSPILDSLDYIAQRTSFAAKLMDQFVMNTMGKATEAGKRLFSSLSTDQISAGWGKYGEKVASVQTIMNATGKSIDDVNGYLDQLMWFSDETSYGFTDMTAALGQMASSGGDVEKLIPLITGVANATAFAGKGASEFSRIMYNLNQSYAQGYLGLMDWKSIELAGAASQQLKQALIDAAVAQGKVNEGAITMANFSTTLQEKWADTEVIEAAFGRFAEASQEAYKMVNSGEVDTASEAYEILASRMDGFAIKAAKSAQEAKTFGEAISSAQDAVSSGWMNTYELLFGNYEEAKVLWTDLANTLWDIFASGAENRNQILEEWISYGGKSSALRAISNAWNSIWTIVSGVREAFSDIFPSVTGLQLARITQSFEEFTKKLAISEDASDKLKRAFRGLFSIFDIGITAIKRVSRVISTFLKSLVPTSNSVLELAANFGDYFVNLRNSFKETKSFDEFMQKFKNRLARIGEEIKNVFSAITMSFSLFINRFRKQSGDLAESSTGLDSISEKFSEQIEFFKNIGEAIKDVFRNIGESIGEGFNSLKQSVIDYITGFSLSDLKTAGIIGVIASFAAYLTTFIKHSKNGLTHLELVFGKSKIVEEVSSFFRGLSNTFSQVKSAFNRVSEVASETLDTLRESLVLWQNQIRAEIIVTIAKAIAILTISVVALSMVDPARLKAALGGLGTMLLEITAAIGGVGKITSGTSFKNLLTVGPAVTELAIAMIFLSYAVRSLAKLDTPELTNGIIGLGATMAVLFGELKFFGAMDTTIKKFAGSLILFGVALNAMAGAVAILGKTMNKDEMEQGIGAISGLIFYVGLLMKATGKSQMALGTGFAVLALAGAMVVFAQACKVMATIPEEELKLGLDTMAGAMVAIGVLSKVMGKKGIVDLIFGDKAVSAGMGVAILGIAAGVAVLSDACIKMSMIDPNKLGMAWLALAGIMSVLGVFSRSMVNTKGLITTATSLVIMSAAIQILGDAFLKMSALNFEQVAAGITALGLSLLAVMGYLALAPKLSTTIAAAAGLSAMAGALWLLVEPFRQLASLEYAQVGAALLALGGALTVIGLYLQLAPSEGIIKSASALAIMSVGLLAISTALSALASIPLWNDGAGIGGALIGLAGALVVLGVAVKTIGRDMKGAGTIAVLAAAMLMLTPVLLALAAIPIISIVAAIAGMAAAFTVIGIAAKLLAPHIVSILLLATSIAAVGASIAGVGWGISYFSAELAALGLTVASAVGNAQDLILAIIEMLPDIIVGFAEGFFRLLELLSEKGPVITDAFIALISIICGAIVQGVPLIVESAIKLIVGFLQAISDYLPMVMQLAARIIIVFMAGIAANIGTITELAVMIIVEFVNGIAARLPDIINAGFNLLLAFITGLTMAVENNVEPIVAEVFKLGSAIIKGVVNGIISGFGHVVNAVVDIGAKIVDTFCDIMGIHSPSKVMYDLGGNVVEGLNDGITDNEDTVSETMAGLGKSLTNNLGSSLEYIPDEGARAMKSLDNAFSSGFSDVDGLAGDSMDGILATMAAFTPQFGEQGTMDMTALIAGMSGEEYNLVSTSGGLSTASLGEFNSYKPKFDSTGTELGRSVANGLRSTTKDASTSAKAIAVAAYDALNSFADDFYEVGQASAMGFVYGMKSKIREAARAAAEIARAAYAAAMDAVDAHSPSRKFFQLGRWVDEGFADGIMMYGHYVSDAASAMSDDTVSMFTSTIRGLSATLMEEFDETPTIRPVVDLSNVKAASQEVDALLSKETRLNLAQPVHMADKVAVSIGRQQSETIQNGSEPRQERVTQNFTFNQNNYSPKTLSRLDIYRQTRNQFNAFREKVSNP